MMVSKKVILLGKYGSGKTSLIRQFVHQKFSESYRTTIGVSIEKKILEHNGLPVSLLIWDIAGETTQQKVADSYKRGAHGIIYVYDLTRPSTYESLPDELTQLAALLPGVPVLPVGNKSDLVAEGPLLTMQHELPLTDGLLTSARTGKNVIRLFEEITSRMLR